VSEQVQIRINQKTGFFWVIMQRVVVIPYRPLGKTYRSHLQGSRIRKKKSVRNYRYSLRNNPEERRSPLLRGGRPKSRINKTIFILNYYLFILVVTNNSMEQNPAGVANSVANQNSFLPTNAPFIKHINC